MSTLGDKALQEGEEGTLVNTLLKDRFYLEVFCEHFGVKLRDLREDEKKEIFYSFFDQCGYFSVKELAIGEIKEYLEEDYLFRFVFREL